MRVCLFEDHKVALLEPLSLTRPVFDLLCGQTSLATRQCRVFAPCLVGALVRPTLAELVRQQRPGLPVNDLSWLQAAPTVLVNGRWLPAGVVDGLGEPCVATIEDEIAYAVLGPEQLARIGADNLDEEMERWRRTLPRRQADGKMVHFLWDLVNANGEQIERDFQELTPRPPGDAASLPLAVVGPRERLLVDPTAEVDPMVVADTRNGPVILDREVVVHAFTRLEGPCYLGPGTHVLGAKIRAGTSLGPQCRIGGEVECSIVQGYSNKYHDGFLGHAYVGEWVNLGAGTSNSDLRDDYGPVSVTVQGRVVSTGQRKVGCFLGDHTKSGLGTLLNTGTNAGVFCNLLPGGLLPRYVPSFGSWWNESLIENGDLSRLLETAVTVMQRRGIEMSAAQRELYTALHEQTASERRRALREAEARRLRRSA
jgi:UDP-N-acetylglucosamine diphosphorylase/glucosamine-1-phosphate N-acetyltransferase